MKSAKLMCITAMTLFAALAIPVRLGAQDNQDQNTHHKYHHYQLIDLGTLGGPNSFLGNPLGFDINNHGTVIAESDTPTPDAYAPNCFQTLFGECLVNHTLQWKDGHATDLGALSGINSTFPFWINARGWIAGISETGLISRSAQPPPWQAQATSHAGCRSARKQVSSELGPVLTTPPRF